MKRVTNAWMVGLVACATMAGAACNRTPAERDETPAAETATAPRSDAAITTAVQARYYADDTVRGRHIDVNTQNGVVTLRGTVDSEAAKQQAVNLAQRVEGVSRVEDQLQVGAATETAAARETAPPTAGERPEQTGTAGRAGEEGTAGRTVEGRVQPAWITTKIQAQYFVNPEIKPWNIDVTTTSDGVVTLEGEVETAADKSEAVRIARETEGVTRVEDRLRLEGEAAERDTSPAARAERAVGDMSPDAWLTAKVQAKYFMDDEVKGRNIDVDTHDGVVTLKGTVGTESERRQAVALARNTDGVKDVNDQLQIEPESAEAGEQRPERTAIPPVTPVVDDTWITTKIQSKYFLDQDVKGHQINVDTRKGIVTLAGTVETEEQKQQAERIASDTDGVSKVVNNLVVGRR